MCNQQSLRSACTYAQSDQSLCLSLEYSMIVKLLTEHHLEFLSLKGSCSDSSEFTLVKMPHCWKSHVAAQMLQEVQWAYTAHWSYWTHGFRWFFKSQVYGSKWPPGAVISDRGAWLAGFMLGTTKHCYTLNMFAVGLMVSDFILVFPF